MAVELTCPGPVSTRLNYLYEQVRDPDTGRRFTDRHVSEWINEKAGRQVISGTTLHYLRKGGRKSHPKRRTLLAVADFFNVPSEYFSDPATVDRINSYIDVLAAVADPRVYNITIKAAGQHPKILDAIDQLLEQASATSGALPTHLTAEVVKMATPKPDLADWHSAPFDQIRCNDLRLVKVVGGGWLFERGDMTIADAVNQDHTVGVRLDRHSAALASWVSRVASATLDEIAGDLMDVWQRHKPPNGDRSGNYPHPDRTSVPSARLLPGLVARLGLDGTAPQSLSVAAARTAASRELIRQGALQIEAAAQAWVWAPAIDEALNLASCGMTADQFAQELMDRGIATRPWHPLAVDSLARLCGRQPPVRMEDPLTDEMIVGTAAKLLHVKDVISIDDLTAALSAASISATPERIKAVAASSRRLLAAGPWITLASSGGRFARVHQTVRGMLSVAGQLTAETLMAGLARRRAGKMLNDALPPANALEALLGADPDYIVHVHKRPVTIRLRNPITPDQAYPQNSCAHRFIAHLQDAPEQTATRQELCQLAVASGYSIHTATKLLSCHEAFISRRPHEWTLVSNRLTPRKRPAVPDPLRRKDKSELAIDAASP